MGRSEVLRQTAENYREWAAELEPFRHMPGIDSAIAAKHRIARSLDMQADAEGGR